MALKPDEYVVWTSNLTHHFGQKTVLDKINLQVRPGDIFGLVGPNGAGKTTLLKVLLGLLKPGEGQANIFGYDISQQPKEALKRVTSFIPEPSVLDTLLKRPKLNLLVVLSQQVATDAVVGKVLEASPEELRQKLLTEGYYNNNNLRVNPESRLFILDEPSSGLDAVGRLKVWYTLRNLAERGDTVLLASQLLEEVQQVCNRIAIIQNGQVTKLGQVADILAAEARVRVYVQPDELRKTWQILDEWGVGSQLKVRREFLEIAISPDQSRKVNQLLANNGLFATQVLVHNPSLEEYYLNFINMPSL